MTSCDAVTAKMPQCPAYQCFSARQIASARRFLARFQLFLPRTLLIIIDGHRLIACRQHYSPDFDAFRFRHHLRRHLI